MNEVFRGTTFDAGGTEWVELVVVEDMTAAELEACFIGDTDATLDTKAASLRFQNMSAIAAEFPAGTIFLVGGSGAVAQDIGYDYPDDRCIALTATGGHFAVRGTINLLAPDLVWIDAADAPDQSIGPGGFGVAWDAGSGALFNAATTTIPPPFNNGPSTSALGGDVALAGNAGEWVAEATATPGAGNGGANSASIAALPVEISAFALE